MPKQVTTELFVERAMTKWGNRYSYPRTIYKSSKDKLIITCKEHGDFLINPNNFLQGKGCKCCSNKYKKTNKKTTKNFIEEVEKIHPYFDFSKVKYTSALEKVIVICPWHGEFETIASRLLKNKCCNGCKLDVASIKYRLPIENFIYRAELKHGVETYDYSDTAYENMHSTIKIKCNNCNNIFERTPYSFLKNYGCDICYPNISRGWTKESWVDFCKRKNCQFSFAYITKHSNKDEEFIKIGITTDKERRLCEFPYDVEAVNIILGRPEYVFDLEKKLHRFFKSYKYKPLIKFGGHTECFSTDILQDPNFQPFLQN